MEVDVGGPVSSDQQDSNKAWLSIVNLSETRRVEGTQPQHTWGGSKCAPRPKVLSPFVRRTFPITNDETEISTQALPCSRYYTMCFGCIKSCNHLFIGPNLSEHSACASSCASYWAQYDGKAPWFPYAGSEQSRVMGLRLRGPSNENHRGC